MLSQGNLSELRSGLEMYYHSLLTKEEIESP